MSATPDPEPLAPSEPPGRRRPWWFARQDATVKAAVIAAVGAVLAACVVLIPAPWNGGGSNVEHNSCTAVGDKNRINCTESDG
jgi:hypothetical protein